MKYVIVEGTDGAGKTYLVDQIKNAFVVSWVMPVGPPQTADVFHEYLNDVTKFYSAVYPTVFDRFHFGTVAYGTVFRNKPDLSPAEYGALEAVLSAMGTLVIYAEPPWDTVKTNLAKRSEQSEFEKSLQKLGTVRELMRNCFTTTALKKYRHDYTIRGSLDALFDYMDTLGFERRPGR